MPDVKPKRPKSPPLTPDHHRQIVELYDQGLKASDIARHLGVNGQQVAGFIQTHRLNANSSPDPSLETPEMSNPPPPDPQNPPAVPVPVPVPPVIAAPTRPAPRPILRDQGFGSGGRSIVIDSGGFTSPISELKWTIERIQPSDGVLGIHSGPFSLEELGQLYGSGTYRITKQEPGKGNAGIEWIRKLGDNWGPPKAPKAGQSSQQPQTFQRPWMRPIPEGREEMGPMHPGYHRPFFRPAPAQDSNDSSVAEALRQMGQNQRELMHQQKETPDSKISEFLSAQTALMNQRWDQEREREEGRRKEEEQKWERQRKEDRDRWDREQEAAKQIHDREMQRIKAENEARLKEMQIQADEREKREQERQKFLLDLEDKRHQLVKQEAENQQKRLESEISRTREEMNKVQERTTQEIKESRDTTQKALEQNQAELNDRLEREREVLEREYKIREKGMEKEHELNREILNMQKQHLESQTGDQLFNMIQTFVREASKGLEKICDLKKLEAMTPEAQAAAVARGTMDGNVLNGPPLPRAESPAVQPASAPAPAASVPANGSQPQPIPEGSSGIEIRVHKLLEQPEGRALFQDIIQEWATHVEADNDPSVFATLYLEMLQNQKDPDTRLFCTILFTLMSARPWTKMHAFLMPYLTPETAKIFEEQRAEVFYEGFRGMVHAQMKEYWIQLTLAAQAKQAKPGAAVPQQIATPSPAEVPVEPPGEGAKPEVSAEPIVIVEDPQPPAS